jgi:hypothetical protein
VSWAEMFTPLPSQGVLVDRAVLTQHGQQRERHLGIIGVGPGRRGQSSLNEQAIDDVRVEKEAFAEGVAHRQAFQGDAGALQADVGWHHRDGSSSRMYSASLLQKRVPCFMVSASTSVLT